MTSLRVAGAQINPMVGDIEGNSGIIVDVMRWAEDEAADVLLLPELALTGYPPEDLVLREAFVERGLRALKEIAAASGNTTTVVGFVDRTRRRHQPDAVGRSVANAAAVVAEGRLLGAYHKCVLPNYGVFDEARYFVPGSEPARVWEISGVPVGVSVCEDIWTADGPPFDQAAAGAEILLNINGSPYHIGKGIERSALLASAAERAGVPVVYVNMVGGQDELVFDGESMVFDADGRLLYRGAQFREERFVVDVPLGPSSRRDPAAPRLRLDLPEVRERLSDEEEVYRALELGLRDYVRKNGFEEAVVGLSGGIDSALTCALAVDALGSGAVRGVSMPARYSSAESVDDARELATRLGCRFDILPVDAIFAEYLEALDPLFAGTDEGVAEENLQARIRGAMLMAISNKFGGIVVATGNKSEMAVGYATLYGDMAGGFAVLKDVFKTLVYRLARWRNRQGGVIPTTILTKAPSAELRPDQLDTDTLPDYEILDEILRRYIERDEDAEKIIADGIDADLVNRMARMVDRNEYKRRQAAPGVKITQKAFGKDRRLPITYRGR